jgi:hypothetical protein
MSEVGHYYRLLCQVHRSYIAEKTCASGWKKHIMDKTGSDPNWHRLYPGNWKDYGQAFMMSFAKNKQQLYRNRTHNVTDKN